MKKNVLTLFCITLLTLAGFPSCSDKENKGEAIRNPIAANLPGKWTMTKSYEKKDGEWKEVIEPEGSGTTYLFRTDGSMMSAVTYANHDTYLRSRTWAVEDHDSTLKINYKTYNFTNLLTKNVECATIFVGTLYKLHLLSKKYTFCNTFYFFTIL